MNYYVSSPFTDDDWEVRERRYALAVAFCASAVAQRLRVYSPIVHWAVVAERHGLSTDAADWLWLNLEEVDRADGLIVLAIDGWRASVGVAQELERARQLGHEIRFYVPKNPEGEDWAWISEATAREWIATPDNIEAAGKAR